MMLMGIITYMTIWGSVMNEDDILRAQHPLYNEWMQDDGTNDEYEYDRFEEAEAQWELSHEC